MTSFLLKAVSNAVLEKLFRKVVEFAVEDKKIITYKQANELNDIAKHVIKNQIGGRA